MEISSRNTGASVAISPATDANVTVTDTVVADTVVTVAVADVDTVYVRQR